MGCVSYLGATYTWVNTVRGHEQMQEAFRTLHPGLRARFPCSSRPLRGPVTRCTSRRTSPVTSWVSLKSALVFLETLHRACRGGGPTGRRGLSAVEQWRGSASLNFHTCCAPIARSVAHMAKFASHEQLRTNDKYSNGICVTDLAIGAHRKRSGRVC